MNNQERPRQAGLFGFARRGTTAPSEIGSIPGKGVRGATREEVKAANAGNFTPRGLGKFVLETTKRHPVIIGGSTVLAIGGVVTGALAVVQASQNNTPGIHRSIGESLPSDSAFNNTTSPTITAETERSNAPPKEVFDNITTKKITNRNAIQMTIEEYQKIAPPTIEGDSINIPITIVSKDGQIRELSLKRGVGTYGGIRNTIRDGETISKTHTEDTLIISGLKPGDIFELPITATKIYHYAGRKNPDGTLDSASYEIDGYDNNGNIIYLSIITVAIKPIMETPSAEDYTETVQTTIKTRDGTEFDTIGYRIAHDKIPEVTGEILDPVFEISTSSNHKFFPGQIKIQASTVVNENGTETRGGARINISTLDNKAIVLR